MLLKGLCQGGSSLKEMKIRKKWKARRGVGTPTMGPGVKEQLPTPRSFQAAGELNKQQQG